MVKDMLSQIQHTSTQSEKDVDDSNDGDGDVSDKDDDGGNIRDRSLKLNEGVSGQVNILASASRQLLEGGTQKQVNGLVCTSFWLVLDTYAFNYYISQHI